ncbi:MAG: hypothetical protein HYZ89_08490 [Candidatus Omnitrophica bacterium]|nr:hypothetical protein [Candidatus Omnitrophota bacterium]
MRRAVLLFLGFLVYGCATAKVLQPTGGSRADGIIELSYEYGAFERPIVDLNQAVAAARERCRAWGYDGAEAFGGTRSLCQASNQYGCLQYFVTLPYQCIGSTSIQAATP